MYSKLFTITEPQINGYRTDPHNTYLTRVISIMPEPEEPQCSCAEFIGDDTSCPVHGNLYQEYRDNASEAISAHWGTSEAYRATQPSHNEIYPY